MNKNQTIMVLGIVAIAVLAVTVATYMFNENNAPSLSGKWSIAAAGSYDNDGNFSEYGMDGKDILTIDPIKDNAFTGTFAGHSIYGVRDKTSFSFLCIENNYSIGFDGSITDKGITGIFNENRGTGSKLYFADLSKNGKPFENKIADLSGLDVKLNSASYCSGIDEFGDFKVNSEKFVISGQKGRTVYGTLGTTNLVGTTGVKFAGVISGTVKDDTYCLLYDGDRFFNVAVYGNKAILVQFFGAYNSTEADASLRHIYANNPADMSLIPEPDNYGKTFWASDSAIIVGSDGISKKIAERNEIFFGGKQENGVTFATLRNNNGYFNGPVSALFFENATTFSSRFDVGFHINLSGTIADGKLHSTFLTLSQNKYIFKTIVFEKKDNLAIGKLRALGAEGYVNGVYSSDITADMTIDGFNGNILKGKFRDVPYSGCYVDGRIAFDIYDGIKSTHVEGTNDNGFITLTVSDRTGGALTAVYCLCYALKDDVVPKNMTDISGKNIKILRNDSFDGTDWKSTVLSDCSFSVTEQKGRMIKTSMNMGAGAVVSYGAILSGGERIRAMVYDTSDREIAVSADWKSGMIQSLSATDTVWASYCSLGELKDPAAGSSVSFKASYFNSFEPSKPYNTTLSLASVIMPNFNGCLAKGTIKHTMVKGITPHETDGKAAMIYGSAADGDWMKCIGKTTYEGKTLCIILLVSPDNFGTVAAFTDVQGTHEIARAMTGVPMIGI